VPEAEAVDFPPSTTFYCLLLAELTSACCITILICSDELIPGMHPVCEYKRRTGNKEDEFVREGFASVPCQHRRLPDKLAQKLRLQAHLE
jgi:hypothetical protein